jgi:hypothetical protein
MPQRYFPQRSSPWLAPAPIGPCGPGGDSYFYFRVITESNDAPDGERTVTPDGRVGRSHSAMISNYQEKYEDDYVCRNHRNRYHLIGSVRLVLKEEIDVCGTNAGDNAYRIAKVKSARFTQSGQVLGFLINQRRCFPSDSPYNNREAFPDFFRAHTLTSEPVWLCDK